VHLPGRAMPYPIAHAFSAGHVDSVYCAGMVPPGSGHDLAMVRFSSAFVLNGFWRL
jgi:hypothetical protein